MKQVSGALVVIFVIALIMFVWVFTHLSQPMAGVTVVRLPLGCRLEVFDRRVVSEPMINLTCPGQAQIQVWPPPKGKLWCQECVANFWKQLDWGEVLPEIKMP